MKIKLLNKQKKYNIDIKKLEFVINIFLKYKIPDILDRDNVELYVSFVSPIKIKALKNELFNLNIFTDVISVGIENDLDFIANNPEVPMIFGEIFICPEVANQNAKKYANTFEKEIETLLIHGLLHLLNYEDYTDAEKAEMREEEKLMLNRVDMEREYCLRK